MLTLGTVQRIGLPAVTEIKLAMLDMADRGLQQLSDVVVVEVIEHLTPVAMADHEPEVPKHPQLLGDRRGRHLDRGGELVNTDGPTLQLTEDAYAAWSRESLHRISDRLRETGIELMRIAQATVTHTLDYICMTVQLYSYRVQRAPVRSRRPWVSGR